jgi:hypothetical protein
VIYYWNNYGKIQKPASFFMMSGLESPKFNLYQAKQQLHNGYADYICGRVIKCDIYNNDKVDPWGYDRDNGQGSFLKVVDNMRS